VIGVLVSGGLDSLAVLVNVLTVAAGRRVVAFTTDLTDDAGQSAAPVVRRLLTDLELAAELVILDPARDRAEPVWSAVGPRLDALPEVNAGAARRAVELGVDVLLSGDGADELLGVPPHELIPAAGPLPEASPFLHDSVIAAALALPLGDRYGPGLPSAYLRCKAQVAGLLPAHALPVLPRRKQYYSRTLAQQAGAGRNAPLCLGAGLLDPAALAAETDPAVLLVVAGLERWLAGAQQYAGVTIG
jgi:hypothetical protein